MPLTRKQKIHALKIARKYVRIKTQLENPFKTELRRYFAQQNRRIARGLEIQTIAPVLDKQYKRITRKLTGIKLKQDDRETEDRILIILFGRAGLQASRIDKTTNKLLRRAIEFARSEIAESGELFPAVSTINRIASNIMRGYSKGRVGGIAVFETQALTEKIRDELTKIAQEQMEIAIFEGDQAAARDAADLAESQRFAEIAENVGTVPIGELLIASRLLRKTWVTMGDSKVRPHHQAANFQTVPENEPFIVMGENLMFPGDTSLGASLINVSNCRCTKVNM